MTKTQQTWRIVSLICASNREKKRPALFCEAISFLEEEGYVWDPKRSKWYTEQDLCKEIVRLVMLGQDDSRNKIIMDTIVKALDEAEQESKNLADAIRRNGIHVLRQEPYADHEINREPVVENPPYAGNVLTTENVWPSLYPNAPEEPYVEPVVEESPVEYYEAAQISEEPLQISYKPEEIIEVDARLFVRTNNMLGEFSKWIMSAERNVLISNHAFLQSQGFHYGDCGWEKVEKGPDKEVESPAEAYYEVADSDKEIKWTFENRYLNSQYLGELDGKRISPEDELDLTQETFTL